MQKKSEVLWQATESRNNSYNRPPRANRQVYLRKVLGKNSLTFEELTTVLCKVEAVINSRTLTTATEDDLEEPLTPNHLIYGRDLRKHRFEHTSTNHSRGVFNQTMQFYLNHVNTLLEPIS